jgi:hypothetical protein
MKANLRVAYRRLGISSPAALLLLFCSLTGSYLNIRCASRLTKGSAAMRQLTWWTSAIP